MAKSSQRFLIIRLSSIGDIVHALPAVSALSEKFPEAEIHWAVETRHAALLEGNPFLHRIVELDTLGWRRKLGSLGTVGAVARSLATLREVEFDAAVDFQGLYKSALVAWLSHARQRLGFAKQWLREPAAAVFYSERVAPQGRDHVIQMNLALVERLGVPPAPRERWRFPLARRESDERHVEEQLAALGTREFMVVNPGGGWRSKCWAPENYAQLVGLLEKEFGGDVLLTGSREEEALIQDIIRDSGSQRAKHFPSTITQFIALVRRARLFLGGDTGPLHVAAALGTPVVALYGPTDPARNGPFAPDDITLWNRGPITYTRRGSAAGYIADVTVESVLAALRERLARAYG
jgi:heptosyltransferase-1